MEPKRGAIGWGVAAVLSAVLSAGVSPVAAQGPAEAPVAGLVELPPAATGNFEPEERERLREAREAVERLPAPGAHDRGELARAFGELGSLYLLHDLMEPAEAALANARTLDPDAFPWHYYLGVLHFREGRPAEAEASLRRALALRPDDLATTVRLGRLAVDAGRLDEAERRFEAALELDPESAAALAGLGRIAYERGRHGRAVELFERALELQPEATSLHHRLGLAYRALGDLERARVHLELNRHDPVSFPDPLVAGLAPLLRGASVQIHRGTAAMKAGDLDRALAEYRAAAELDPQDPKAHYNLGVVMLRKGERERAIRHLERAVELDPGYRNARVNLAAAHAESGDWARAAEQYGEAVRIDPLDHAARLDWATALERSGRGGRAVEELDALLAQVPDSRPQVKARAHLQRAVLAESAGRQDLAAEHYRAAVELDPALRPAWVGLGRARAQAGELGDAAAAFDRAVELDPADPEARFGRAMALLLGGTYARAREVLEDDLAELAEAAETGALPLAHLLARLLATAPQEAVRDPGRAVDLALRVFEAERSLGHAETVAMAYAAAGDFDRAVEWQSRVLERAGPGSPPELVERARRRLALYQAGRPVLEPWREGG